MSNKKNMLAKQEIQTPWTPVKSSPYSMTKTIKKKNQWLTRWSEDWLSLIERNIENKVV